MEARKSKSAYAAVILCAATMGTLGLLVRESSVHSSVLNFVRYTIAFLCLAAGILALRAWKGKEGYSLQFSPSSFCSGACISLCAFSYFMAIQSISLGVAAFTLNLGPIFAVVGEAIVSRKAPRPYQLLILAIAVLGLVLMSAESFGHAGNIVQPGLLWALLAAAFYGGFLLINRMIPAAVKLPARLFGQSCASSAAGGLSVLGLGAPMAAAAQEPLRMFIIGTVYGLMIYLLSVYAISRLRAVEFGVLSYIEPLLALVLGMWVYHESSSTMQLLGIALILVASVMQCMKKA